MSTPVRPLDPLVAAALAFGESALSAAAPVDEPVPPALAAALAAAAAASERAVAPLGADTLLLGAPPVANPVLPELLAARARLLLRPDEEEYEGRTDAPPEESPFAAPRDGSDAPPEREEDEPAP